MRTATNLLGGGTLHLIRSSRPKPLVLRRTCDGSCGAKGVLLGLPNRLEELMFRRFRNLALAVLVAVAGLAFIPANAYALSVSTAELKDGQLRVEGQDAAPGVFVIVSSTTSSAGIRSDASGDYQVAASGFRADDCTVVVSDRRTFTATVDLAGCSPTPVSPPSPDPAPTGDCVITAGDPPAQPTRFAAGSLFAAAACGPHTGLARGGGAGWR